MKNKLTVAIDKFYHDMAIVNLRLQNSELYDSKLTYNSMMYLDIISAHSGEYTASNIADMLHVARPSVTQKLNELEKLGHIVKKQSKTDKRIYYIHINEEMIPQEFIDKYEKIEQIVIEKFADSYSQEDLDKFFNMLSIIGTIYLEELSK